MKRILSVLIILVLTAYAPVVNAGLAGSTVLSISLANLDPNPAIAGDSIDVRIGIENIGGTTANNIMMEIVPGYPFDLVPGENAVKDVGIIEGYEVDSTKNIKIVKYRLKINKDTSAGIYELKVKYYGAGSSDVIMKSLYIDVKSRANVEIIHIDKASIVPGKQSSLKFTINNAGNAPLRDITFNWENKDNTILPVGSDNTRYIKYIDISESFDLEYQVIADTNANAGLYKLNLYLTFTDSINGTTKQLSTIAGVYVGGGTNFDIVFSESTNGETSFSVANIGSNKAYSVSVIIPDQRSWIVSGSNSVIIGNLNSGDYTVASFKLHSSVNSSSETVQMQIAYTDTMGERKVVDKEVKLGLQNIAAADGQTAVQGRKIQSQQGSPDYIVYIIGIAVLFIGFTTYQKFRRQKLLDPDFNIRNLFGSKNK